jgi:hypothetical protein
VRLLLGLPEETGEMRAIRVGDDGPTPFDTAQFKALSNLTANAPESEQSSGAA